MNTELIVSSNSSDEVVIALLREGKLVELQNQKGGSDFSVGDIYLGKVEKLLPGLNAAFVDVGHSKGAFLHYHDLGPQIRSLNKFMKRTLRGRQNWNLEDFRIEKDINKDGKIGDVIKAGQHLLVQIEKEPISTKGPRISSEISLAGRYLVLVPFSERISISQKIKDAEERDRLKRLLQSIKPKGFGVIIRTVAQQRKVAELDADLANLLEKWRFCHKQLQRLKPPAKILGELNRVSAILRDILNDSFNSIVVDNQDLEANIVDYLHDIAPGKVSIVKPYKGKAPIFEHYGIERQIKSSFGRSVSMSKGAYLIIEHTEALHVIDVNSGNRTNSKEDQETNALSVNLQAADEIARQLRLRDMGGIIVVDFIDMHKAENRKKLYERMKEAMKDDRAKHKILPPSRFGLVQITRQRVRPEMNIKTVEKCPTCKGSGEIEASVLITDEIEEKLHYLLTETTEKGIYMATHPFIGSYFTNGLISQRMKWFFKYKKWISIRPMTSYHFLEYQFFNSKDEQLEF